MCVCMGGGPHTDSISRPFLIGSVVLLILLSYWYYYYYYYYCHNYDQQYFH